MEHKRFIQKPIIIIVIFIIIIIGVSLLVSSGIFYRNPLGNFIKIDNYKQYFKDLPQNYYDSATSILYNMVEKSFDDPTVNLPKSGAIIRNDSLTTSSTEDPAGSITSFLVDIASIERTYRIQFTQINDQDNTNNITYPVVIFCPTKQENIYPDFSCTDITNSSPIAPFYEENPFLNHLPITVSKYTDKGIYVSYRITYSINDDKSIKITITDKTGGNYENALADLRKIGADPAKLTVEYKAESEFVIPGRAPGGI